MITSKLPPNSFFPTEATSMNYLMIGWMLLLQIGTTHAATSYFDYTTEARSIYDAIMTLRFEEAESKLKRFKQQSPDNLVSLHLENYIDFLKIYIEEDKRLFEQAESRKNRRLAQIEKGDEDSPYYLYLQADIRLQWAIARIKFEEWIGAFRDINQAFKLLEENQKRFPDFMPNKKNLGVLHAMVSALPSGVEWVSSLEGDFKKGTSELREVLAYAKQNDFIFERETYILYAYVLLQIGEHDEAAWRIIQQSNLNATADPASAFILANVAMKSGRNDKAIQYLKSRPTSSSFYPFPHLDFMLGKAKLHRLDGDADRYFKKYLSTFKGQNYIKESYRLLAWHELVQGRPNGYWTYLEKVNQQGSTLVGADESAAAEAQFKVQPDRQILKARLLFDGAYYQRAYNILLLQSTRTFDDPKAALEYHYFLGRCTHTLKRYDEALQHYANVVQQGSDEAWYYACRAALESGRIYEAKGKKEAARNAYEVCLSIRPKEHRYSLHQQAKSALNRL